MESIMTVSKQSRPQQPPSPNSQALNIGDRTLLAVLAGARTVAQARQMVDSEVDQEQFRKCVGELREARRLQAAEQIEADSPLALPPTELPFRTNDRIRDAIPPHNYAEMVGLATGILRGGIRPRITLWHKDDSTVIADGHIAVEICVLWGRQFDTVDLDQPDIEAVVRWRADVHYSSRSVTREWRSWWRGTQFRAAARLSVGRPSKSSEGRTITNAQKKRTGEVAAEIAARYGVSRSTIYTDCDYATWIDRIATVAGDDVRQELLARRRPEWRWSVSQIETISAMNRADLTKAVEKMRRGERPALPSSTKVPTTKKQKEDPPATSSETPLRQIAANLFGDDGTVNPQVARELLSRDDLLPVAEEIIQRTRARTSDPANDKFYRPGAAWLSTSVVMERIPAWRRRGEGHDAEIDATGILTLREPSKEARSFTPWTFLIDGQVQRLWPVGDLLTLSAPANEVPQA